MEYAAMANDYQGEPRLTDLLDDPLTALLMQRDGVEKDEVSALFARIRAVLAADEGEQG
jgi:hypothetical protein